MDFHFQDFFNTSIFKSTNPSLKLYTKCSFLACVALTESFAKNDGFWYLKYWKYVYSSFINSCWNFDVNFLCLFSSVASSGVGSCVGSRVIILYKFFFGDNLLLKLLRAFSLALNNKPKLFKKTLFQLFFFL